MEVQTSPLKFYTDTHIAKAVATQLRSRGIDIIRCEEVGMATASDAGHLEYATGEGRVMVSQDDDFVRLHAQWQQGGKVHAGIILLPKHLQGEAQISYAVRELLTYYEMIEGHAGTIENDIANRMIFL